ncbi:MAG: DUF1127 domain-containing protein [Rhodospirillales bacterium]|nr:DUF1127 domain-containing protein [Rhodospirillales bacterium]
MCIRPENLPWLQLLGAPAAKERGARTLSRLVSVVRLWRERARARAELARLTDRELRDIGISRCDVYREIWKPFWRK